MHPRPFPIMLASATLSCLTCIAVAQEASFTDGVDISASVTGSADLFVEGNTVLDAFVCVGFLCGGDQHDFSAVEGSLQISDATPWISFVDRDNETEPNWEWTLLVNERRLNANVAPERFYVRGKSANTIPFTIEGNVTQGSFCVTPSDAVFDPEAFAALPIEKHAEPMWENRFVGAVGPTGPDQLVNLTKKIGGVIHELEIAHICIEALHERLKTQEADNFQLTDSLAGQQDLIADLLARLAALEGRAAD